MNVEYLEKYYKSKLEDVFFSEKSLTYLLLFEDKVVKFTLQAIDLFSQAKTYEQFTEMVEQSLSFDIRKAYGAIYEERK